MRQLKRVRDGLEWSDGARSIAVEIGADRREGTVVIEARSPIRRLLAAGGPARADALIEDLRHFLLSEHHVDRPMALQLDDGTLEGPDGTRREGFISELPRLVSSEGWSVRDVGIIGAQPLMLGAGVAEINDDDGVGWCARLLLRWPALRTPRLPGGGRGFALTGVTALITEEPSAREAHRLDGRLDGRRSSELAARAYRAATFDVQRTVEADATRVPEGPQAVIAATNASSTTDDLDLLATDPCWIVRAAVATNPCTPANVAAAMLEDASVGVRAALAQNPRAASHVRERLALDPEELVRVANAWSADTSPEILDVHVHDNAWTVRFAAADNPHATDRQLEGAVGDESWQVRAAAAARVDLPLRFFGRLAADAHPMVRIAAAASPLCPAPILDRFASADDRALREVVMGRRSNRYSFEAGIRNLPRFGPGATDGSPCA